MAALKLLCRADRRAFAWGNGLPALSTQPRDSVQPARQPIYRRTQNTQATILRAGYILLVTLFSEAG